MRDGYTRCETKTNIYECLRKHIRQLATCRAEQTDNFNFTWRLGKRINVCALRWYNHVARLVKIHSRMSEKLNNISPAARGSRDKAHIQYAKNTKLVHVNSMSNTSQHVIWSWRMLSYVDQRRYHWCCVKILPWTAFP